MPTSSRSSRPTRASRALARFVEPAILGRGRSYHAGGQVAITFASPEWIEASVDGTRRYAVTLAVERDRLRFTCTCPYAAGGADPCKHVWATVLAAEEDGFLADRALHRLEIDPDVPDFEDDDEDDFDDDYEDHDEDDAGDDFGGGFEDDVEPPDDEAFAHALRELARVTGQVPAAALAHALSGRTPKSAGRGGKAARRERPAWREALDALRADGAAETEWNDESELAEDPAELVHVIDVAETLLSGRPVVGVRLRRRLADGRWGKLRVPYAARDELRSLATPADGAWLDLADELDGIDDDFGRSWFASGWRKTGGVPDPIEIPRAAAESSLRALCATGRVFLQPAAQPPTDELLGPLRWDDGGAWSFELTLSAPRARRPFRLEGALRRGDEVRSITEAQVLLDPGLVLWADAVARLDHHGALPVLKLLRRDGALDVPRGQAAALVAELLARSATLPIALPEELAFETAEAPLERRVRIRSAGGQRGRALLPVEVLFAYDAQVTHPFEPAGMARGASSDPAPPVVDAKRRRLLRRDATGERDAMNRLDALGLLPAPAGLHGGADRLLLDSDLPGVVRALLGEGWRVEAEGVQYRSCTATWTRVETGIDWFGLRGGASFGDVSVELPALLAAARSGERFVTLSDGSRGLLPEQWLERHAGLAELGRADAEGLRFRPSQAALLDALLAASPDADGDRAFARARRRLHALGEARAESPPKSFAGTLRPYQREGLGWLAHLAELGLGGCLADDMGLGKTVQVLALIAARRDGAPRSKGRGASGKRGIRRAARRRPSLVVAPRSLVFNWKAEAERFVPGLRVVEHVGPQRAREARELAKAELVLTTYGTLRRDAELLSEVAFDLVVLDESQAIKNPRAATAKAARLLRGEARIALSGTPIENHLGELWSLFEFLDPGLLGSQAAFSRLAKRAATPDSSERDLIATAVRPFVLRRTKGAVAPELPQRVEQTLPCELAGRQRRDYDELAAHYRESFAAQRASLGAGEVQAFALEALLRLRQAACHPGLIDDARRDESSAKLDALLPELREVVEEGHGALVFSQFTRLLGIVRERLDAEGIPHAYLDGQMRAAERTAQVRRFQESDDCAVFLISLKAGGVGLNLTRAEYVFLLDPWWNPAAEAQAIDRAHRIGQTRTVFARRLVARDTVEERILELQASKRELADAIVRGDAGSLRSLSPEDLERLLAR